MSGISAEMVTAIIPTRGDVDTVEIIESLEPFGFAAIVVFNNSISAVDYEVYARYHAIGVTSSPVIYTQDDDCIVHDVRGLLDRYEPGSIVCNMPQSRWADYPDSALLGWGSVFDRDLPVRAFARIAGPDLLRECDAYFSTLTPHIKFDLGFSHLPWAETPDRLWRQPDHGERRRRAVEQARAVRDQ